MEQIRRRVRDKRGVDYTEEQIRELASVRLEKFLDPKNLRSDLLEQFRKSRPAEDSTLPPIDAPYEFEDNTLYDTHRGLLRTIRRLLNPLSEAVLQSEHDRARPAPAGRPEQALRPHDGPGAHRPRGVELALLRGAAQPGARDHALGHRAQEPQDAGRSAVEPPRLLGAAPAGARRRGAVSARGRGAARTPARSASARRQRGAGRSARCRVIGRQRQRRRGPVARAASGGGGGVDGAAPAWRAGPAARPERAAPTPTRGDAADDGGDDSADGDARTSDAGTLPDTDPQAS